MKGINGTRTKKVKVEENEFFTGADTEAGERTFDCGELQTEAGTGCRMRLHRRLIIRHLNLELRCLTLIMAGIWSL